MQSYLLKKKNDVIILEAKIKYYKREKFAIMLNQITY